MEGMDRSDGDVAALERRWLKPIYTAAPQLVLRHAQTFLLYAHGAKALASHRGALLR